MKSQDQFSPNDWVQEQGSEFSFACAGEASAEIIMSVLRAMEDWAYHNKRDVRTVEIASANWVNERLVVEFK
jgi:hypothetical protein